ncbi:MAG TPA: CxxxxCH/CxxCH domain-containing protein [Anaeromyxobacteraceae bacterium]|nr:CxxxxCH/CxxCH domain-containing protein [Anaeromyxobacteraceae bacterium]
MGRASRAFVVAAAGLLASACGNRPTPSGAAATESKGLVGVHYVVNVSRPVGGTIRSADGRIECGTVGTGKDLCAPVSFPWASTAVLTATPDAGMVFVTWAADCSSAAPSCSLSTAAGGADKWAAAVFSTPDGQGHGNVTSPALHGPMFLAFVKRVPGTPACTRCHGASYGGMGIAPSCTDCHAQAGHPGWLQDCSFCHGNPPASHAATSTNCRGCHPDTVRTDGSIDAASGRHMNGVVDVTPGSCDGCHGAPPSTGAHRAHLDLTAGELALATGALGYGDLGTLATRFPGATPTSAPSRYAFGCGNCHPTDPARHGDGTVDVDVKATAPGSLKTLNAPAAAWDPATGTCSGVYCHSTGQETPTFTTSPGWYSGARIGCDGCHGNPPRHLSGGPGSATANSHFGVNVYGDPWGHVAGLPAPSVGIFKHGGWYGPGNDSSMVSCQTCHFETTDPANTGPSGFYYLDTTVFVDGTALGGWEGVFSCVACHTPDNPAVPTRTGKVLPLRHVNGSRDVAFDQRTTLPAFDWLPYPPDRPTRPYWFTVSVGVAEWDRTLVTWTRDPMGGTTGATAQFDLAAARYDPSTKTCTNVACHMSQGSTNFNPGGPVPVNPPLIPLQWGDTYYGNPWTCRKCHALDPAFAY